MFARRYGVEPLEILDFLCECFTFWKGDFSRLRAISPSTRQNTVRVAQQKREFREAPRHIDVFLHEFQEAPRHINFFCWILQPLHGFGGVRQVTKTHFLSVSTITIPDSGVQMTTVAHFYRAVLLPPYLVRAL